jgi:predicted nucleotidyltransferase
LAQPQKACDHDETYLLPVAKAVATKVWNGHVGRGCFMKPDPAMLDELVRRTVESVHPLRIILFGSAARGDMGPNSDLDTLVVMPNQSDCRGVTKILVRRLRGLGCAAHILVVRQSDMEQHGDGPYPGLNTALTEGTEIYRTAS